MVKRSDTGHVRCHPNEPRGLQSRCTSAGWLPKFPQIQPSWRDYSRASSPVSLDSIAFQTQLLSSEVKKMMGDKKKDLIPRKCSTNLPTRCGATIGLPTEFSLPLVSSVAATLRGVLFCVVLFSLNFHPKDVSKQHFASRPSPPQPGRLLRSLWFPKGRKGEKQDGLGGEWELLRGEGARRRARRRSKGRGRG